MIHGSFVAVILATASTAYAAPAPQVAGGGSGSPSTFGPDSQISAAPQSAAGPDYPVVVGQNGYFTATYHGPYSGSATTTGAVDGPTTLAESVAPLPLNPTATYYNDDGVPQKPFPAPYTPAGGLGTNGSLPRYMVESDFDFESIALGLYQEVSVSTTFERLMLIVFSGSSLTFSMTDSPASPMSSSPQRDWVPKLVH